MNFLRYPNNIILSICIIVFIIIYYFYGSNKIIEGAQTNEEKTKALNETIISFTQDLYDKIKHFITTKTSESTDRSTQILKKLEATVDNIKKSNQVSEEELSRWDNLSKAIHQKKMALNSVGTTITHPGIAIEIQNETYTDKIRGIINKYI